DGDADRRREPRRDPDLLVGLLGLPAHPDVHDAALGAGLGPLRPPSGLPDRARDVPRGLGALGHGPEHGAADRVPDGAGARRRRVVGCAGGALVAAGVSALLLGFVEAGRAGSWSGGDVLAPLGLGLTALALFVAVERRAAEPIVPFRLFGSRMVVAAVVTRFLAGMAMFGAISFVPLFLQSVTGTTATGAGMVLPPVILGWV